MTRKKELIANLALLVRPLIAAVVIGGGLWYFVFHKFLHVLEEDESAYTDAGVPVFAMFHAVIAARILGDVWEKHKKYQRCRNANDNEGMEECKKDRIPMAIHLLIGAMSVITQAHAMLFNFEGAFAGIFYNASLAFVLGLYWEVATTLDNPSKGPWYADGN